MDMHTLFDIAPELPAGFSYIPDFIDEAEEAALAAAIGSMPLQHLVFQGFKAKRKTASFGYDYHFDSRRITPGEPIPAAFTEIVGRVAAQMQVPPAGVAEILLTEYGEGSVINWHRDAPPFDRIAGISLLADCTFRLRPYDKAKQARSAIRSLTVGRRSFYMMAGEARQDWEHSINPVKSLRYSITFRTLRAGM